MAVFLTLGNKTYSLLEGLEVLCHDDSTFQRQGILKPTPLTIEFSDNDMLYFKDDFPLGSGDGDALFSWIEERLYHQFPEEEDSISELILALVDERERLLEVAPRNEEMGTEPTDGATYVLDVTEDGMEEVAVIEKKVASEKPIKKRSGPKKNKDMVNVISSSDSKKKTKSIEKKKKLSTKKLWFFIFPVMVLLLLFIGNVALKQYANSQARKQVPVVVQDAFEQSLRTLTPTEVGQSFPTKHEVAAQYYVEHEEFEKLRDFNKAFPTVNGTFDLAFYDKDWEMVIQTPTDELTDERKIMLAHAYIQLNQLEEAKILNKQLNSERLTVEIDTKRVDTALNLIHKGKLKEAKELLPDIETAELKQNLQVYLDDADLITQMIELYQKKKETDNEEIWQRKLEQIGKVAQNNV